MDRSWSGILAAGGLVLATALLRPPQGATPAAPPAVPPTPPPQETRVSQPRPAAPDPVVTGEQLLREFWGQLPVPRRTGSDTAGAGRDDPVSPLSVKGPFRYTLRATIATVPDPVDSRLDWTYDSYVEAIRRAHERAGYVTDRFWLPWGTIPDTLRVGRARVREAWPGVFLFRRVVPDSFWVDLQLLYVVGEVPTRGVHRQALLQALRERDALLRLADSLARAATPRVRPPADPDTVRIVGPAFSGSALSLRSALEEWLPDTLTPVSIVTGSATNLQNREILTGPVGGRRTTSRIRFAATVHPDEELLEAIEQRVLCPLDIPRWRVAILSESSTAYGQNVQEAARAEAPASGAGREAAERGPAGSRCGEGEFLVVPFPMNISRLRSEYARRPTTPAPAPALPGQQGTAEPRIPIDLSDRARPVESPPVQSQLTIPTLEAMMSEITLALARHDVRAVGILASDVRDKLFLATEVRRRLRDVQVFTLEGNALYLTPEHNQALRGMLVASTYPLVPQNQWWSMRPAERDRLPFTNEGAQGVYNAMLMQLGHESMAVEYAGIEGPDSLWVPKVWITAVGSRSLVPLATDTPTSAWYVRAARVPSPVPAAERTREERVQLEFFTVAAVGLLALLLGILALAAAADGVEGLAETVRRDGGSAERPSVPAARQAVPPEPVAETVRWESLRVHAHLYRILRLVAVGAVFGPAALLVARALKLFGHPWAGPVQGMLNGLLALSWLALALQAAAAMAAILVMRRDAWAYAVGGHWRTAGRRGVWLLEIVGRTGLLGLGGGFLVLTVCFYRQVRKIPDAEFELYLHRAAQLDSGISPLLPLLIGGVGFAVWCTWHLTRIKRLKEMTAFEAASLEQVDRDVNTRLHEWEQLRTRKREARRTKEANTAADRRKLAPRWTLVRTWVSVPLTHLFQIPERQRVRSPDQGYTTLPADVVASVNEARNRLFLLVPNWRGVLLLVVVLLLGGLLADHFYRPLEMVAGTKAFNPLLPLLVVGSLVGTVWAVYRLLAVWRSLNRCLVGVGTTPLLTAFERLPRQVSQLTRLTLVGAPSCEILETVTAAQRRQLDRLAEYAEADRVALRRSAPQLHAAIEAFLASGAAFRAGRGRCRDVAGVAEPYRKLDAVLRLFWEVEPEPPQIEAVKKDVEQLSLSKDEPTPDTGVMFRRSYPNALRLWLRAAEEFAAVQVVDYVEWVLQQMRTLALFLFVSLLLTTLLLSCYPFEPQSLAKAVFSLILLGTVGVLLYVMTDLNRNEVLSRISKTDPGRVTWDRSFLVNAILLGIVPLLALVSSEVPEIRDFLFFWVHPLLRALVSG